ncbi:MAG: sugar ABC transporter substrate-binding protein [Mycobacterium sp.]|nr:sugar ABC transporter substrate-binding protein [Mycobacterium sp.]
MKATAASVVAAAALLAGLCACSVDDTGTEGSTAQVKPSISDPKDLKIAYFSAGSSNAYLQAGISEAKAAAAELGASIDIFDGQFSPQTQFDQMQSAITSGKYNAFAVEPNDGNLVCNLLTQQASAKQILVSVFNLPICGRATNAGEQTWEPGTVNYVGGQTIDVYEKWVDQVKTDHPDGATIALISGPDLNANTIAFFKAAEAFGDDDRYRVVAKQTTDYTTPKGFQAAQTILQANPDLDVIMSNFSGMSRGVVQAAGGRDVAIYDFGGDGWSLDSVHNGRLTSTVMMLPKTESRRSIEGLAEVVEGIDTSRFVNLAESDTLPGTPFVTKDNVGLFTAEY